MMKRLALALIVSLAATYAIADARDGLRHWWKAKDLNGDGLLQPSELCDMMTVSAATPLKANTIVQDATSEMAVPVSIGSGVLHPSMRKTYDSDTYFSLNNPTNYDSEGKLVANWQSITLPNKSSLAIPGATLEGTVIARVKWHGLQAKKYQYISPNWVSNYQYAVTLFANNYYNDGARGWRVGLRMYSSGESTLMYPALFIGNAKSQTELHAYGSNSSLLRLRAGHWYDYAVSFRPSGEEGKMTALFVLRCNATAGDRVHGAYEFTTTVTPKDVPAGWYPSYIGIDGMTTFKDPVGNATSGAGRGENTFGGDISEIKVYDRALSEYEILSEFTDSAPLCEVGSVNSSGDEFSDASAEAVYEPATMEWSKMRKTLNASHPSLSVKCDVEENGHGLGRLVELKLIGENGGDKKIEVAANGRVFGRKAVESDGWIRFFIRPGLMASLAKDAETGKYPLTLTFTRRGDLSGDLVVDYLRVAGGWQLGTPNGSNSEFGGNGEDYYNFHYVLGQNNIKQLVSSIGNQSLYSFLNIYFPVGSWAADNLAHRLTIKTSVANASPIALKMNGASEAYAAFQPGELYNGGAGATVNFPAGSLVGDNRLKLERTDAKNDQVWNYFDYWQFETLWTGRNYDDGGLLIVH